MFDVEGSYNNFVIEVAIGCSGIAFKIAKMVTLGSNRLAFEVAFKMQN